MKRPALGHLLGYTALTVILTAGAAQSLTGTNTVDSGDITDGQVKNADLAADAVRGSKVINNSLTGADVNASTLVLKPGQSETGVFVLETRATGPSQNFGSGQTFRLPLTIDGSQIVKHFAPAGGDSTCTGSSSSPTAPPHTMCAYVSASGNLASKALLASKDGFLVFIRSFASGDTSVSFTYAVKS